jgi:hypothetical protein
MDANSWVCKSLNLSHVIAHEAGHWFGFDRVSACEQCMMSPSIGGDYFPRWQLKSEVMNPLFIELAKKLV